MIIFQLKSTNIYYVLDTMLKTLFYIISFSQWPYHIDTITILLGKKKLMLREFT